MVGAWARCGAFGRHLAFVDASGFADTVPERVAVHRVVRTWTRG